MQNLYIHISISVFALKRTLSRLTSKSLCFFSLFRSHLTDKCTEANKLINVSGAKSRTFALCFAFNIQSMDESRWCKNFKPARVFCQITTDKLDNSWQINGFFPFNSIQPALQGPSLFSPWQAFPLQTQTLIFTLSAGSKAPWRQMVLWPNTAQQIKSLDQFPALSKLQRERCARLAARLLHNRPLTAQKSSEVVEKWSIAPWRHLPPFPPF